MQEFVDADEVIRELNKVKFGDGYITAEYKDKEDDVKVDPEDIDPTTLFVGNFADEVTLEELTNIYPKHSNIQIVSKMKTKPKKNAFVSFNTVSDAIDAFKNTYNKLFHSKNLTVKFRKFNGPIGMPGETKQQNPSKASVRNTTSEVNGNIAKDSSTEQQKGIVEANNLPEEPTISCSARIDSLSYSPQYSDSVDIKSEIEVNSEYDAEFDPCITPVDNGFGIHKPKIKTESRSEVNEQPEENRIPTLKQEPVEDDGVTNNIYEQREQHRSLNNYSLLRSGSEQIFNIEDKTVTVKEEPQEDSGNYF